MLFRMFRTAGAALVLTWGLAAASHAADDWMDLATVSSTMGMNAGRICVGASRTDLGCPTYAPQIGTDGSISASRFVGDGSGLTGVVASTADRIVSGSTSLLAVSGTGFVSLTQAGTNTGWFDPARGLVTLGVSTTGAISGTRGYFNGDVVVRGRIDLLSSTNTTAVGYQANSTNGLPFGSVFGYQAGYQNSGTTLTAVGYQAAYNNASSNVTAIGARAGSQNSATNATLMGVDAGNGNTGSTLNAFGASSGNNNTGNGASLFGNFTGYRNTGNNLAAFGYTAGFGNSGNNVTAIGSNAGYFNTTSNTYNNVTLLGYNARAEKDNQVVLGNSSIVEVSTSGVILAAGVSTTGVVSASRFVGDGSGLTGVVASTADRIVSGSTSLLAVSGTGFVSLTQAGTNTGWFDPARGLVTLGVSATGRISATDLAVRGVIDIVKGTGNVLVGQNAGISNTSSNVTALGIYAASSNTNSFVTSLGGYAGQYNTGQYSTSVGYQAGQYNSGTGVTALGYMAGQYNVPTYMTAVGQYAAQYNAGGAVIAMGRLAAQYNSASTVVAIGNNSSQYNTGSHVVAIGQTAGVTNSGSNVVFVGSYAGQYNGGSYAVGVGRGAVNSNSGSYVVGIGYQAAGSNTGGSVTALGSRAAVNNIYDNVTALGADAQPDKANQVVLGNSSIVEVSTSGILHSGGVSTTGTVTATYVKLVDNNNLACTPERYGTLRYSNGKQYMCMPR